MAKADTNTPAVPAVASPAAPLPAIQVPDGYMLVPKDPATDWEKGGRAAFVAEVGKGAAVRTQEAADKMYPDGDKAFWVQLNDGNGNHRLRIRAVSEADAQARYNVVCGIQSTDPDKGGESRYTVEPAGIAA
jgi:hypothetical protein